MAAVVGEILGLTVSEGISFALGVAMGPALRPLTSDITNHSWDEAVKRTDGEFHRPLDAATLAGFVAQGIKRKDLSQEQARMTGIRDDDFDKLLQAARTVPTFGELDQMLNRGTITQAEFDHALDRMGLEEAYRGGLLDLTNDKLSPQNVALAIVRSLMADPGFLPVDLNVSGGKIPAYPQSSIPPLKEAGASGIDKERLRIMVGSIGNPIGPESAASAVFKGIINRADFNRAILEGNTRPEYADAIFDNARQIPTARDFLENALRGYRTLGEAIDGAALHGMSREHATLIYQNQGRPLNVRQITQALARGAKFHPEPGEIKDPYDASTVEGNVKPAYYEMFKALKYTYPSAFTIRQLAQTGVIGDAGDVEQILLEMGWKPDLARKTAEAWVGTTAGPDSHVNKAQLQLWSTTHRAYLAGDATVDEASSALRAAGVAAGAVDDVLKLWDHERDLDRARLTAAQLKKAYAKAVVNPNTGQPWTRDEVLEELADRGWNQQDANTFLDLPAK